MSAELIANLKTSLARADHAWTVSGLIDSSKQGVPVGETPEPANRTLTIPLVSTVVKQIPGGVAPLGIVYVAEETPEGELVSSHLFLEGFTIVMNDAALHTQITALATAAQTASVANAAASLLLDPAEDE